MNFTAVLMNHIIKNYEWTKKLGHYVYYKENMKKPPKKLLNVMDKKCMCHIISRINNGFEIEDVFKSVRVYDKSSKTKTKTKIKNSDGKQDLVASNVIEEKNEGSTIRLPPDYKFTGVNPYDDLKQPSNMSDAVFKEMIYLRSQFSKSKFSKF